MHLTVPPAPTVSVLLAGSRSVPVVRWFGPPWVPDWNSAFAGVVVVAIAQVRSARPVRILSLCMCVCSLFVCVFGLVLLRPVYARVLLWLSCGWLVFDGGGGGVGGQVGVVWGGSVGVLVCLGFAWCWCFSAGGGLVFWGF
jgi:hypothetical protein